MISDMPTYAIQLLIFVVLCPLIVILIEILNRKLSRVRLKNERRRRKAFWSIGYLQGDHPLKWNPSLAKTIGPKDVLDDMYIIADPFLFEYKEQRYLFYEAMKDEAEKAYIECAKYSDEDDNWNRLGEVLEEEFHLSYPQVFEHDNQVYMIPESKQALRIGLYQAVDFPMRWEYVKPLVSGKKLVDSSIVQVDGHWYLFTSRKKTLYLYHADSPAGEWVQHPKSPVKRGNFSRCAGRILKVDNKLYRLAQDQRGYGAGVYAFEIETLSQTDFCEKAARKYNPILKPGSAKWCETGMHHLDVISKDDKCFAVFDGEQFGA